MPQPKKSTKPKGAAAKRPAAKRATTAKAKPAAKPAPAAKRQGAGRSAQRAAAPQRVSGPVLPVEVREHFGQEVIDLVLADRVPGDASASAIARMFVTAHRYGLNPVREVYLRPTLSMDGAAPSWNVVVTRDGLIGYAERTGRYLGWDGDALYADDYYLRDEPDGDANTMRRRAGVIHKSEHPLKRGELTGAWAVVEVMNPDGSRRPPVYHYASLEDYRPDPGSLDADAPWSRFPSECCVSAALSWALRVAFGLSDLVGADEVEHARKAPVAPAVAPAPAPAQEAPVDDDLAKIIARARELSATEWLPAKVNARLSGASEQQIAAFRGELLGWIAAHEAPIAPAPTEAEPVEDRGDVALLEDVAKFRLRLADVEARAIDVDGPAADTLFEEAELLREYIDAYGFDPDDADAPQATADELKGKRRIWQQEYDGLREDEQDTDRADLQALSRRRSQVALLIGAVDRALRCAQPVAA